MLIISICLGKMIQDQTKILLINIQKKKNLCTEFLKFLFNFIKLALIPVQNINLYLCSTTGLMDATIWLGR